MSYDGVDSGVVELVKQGIGSMSFGKSEAVPARKAILSNSEVSMAIRF